MSDSVSGKSARPAMWDFLERTFEADGVRHRVFEIGQGPAVLVLHELPGMTEDCIGLGRTIASHGFTVVMPLMFGRPGQSSPFRSVLRLCVSREIYLLAKRKSSPVTSWLRALCRDAHERHGGPGVGVVGMCLSGGFVIALMVEPSVIAPVACQPALPLPVTRARRRALGVSDIDLTAAGKRTTNESLSLLCLRFSEDRICPRERFGEIRRVFGDAGILVEIDSGPGNPHGIHKKAHSVVTRDFVDRPGHPTRDAFEQVVGFLGSRLLTPDRKVQS